MQNQDLLQQLTTTLKHQFHFDSFRPGQLEAITTLLTQDRLLCIQPTGHGKSLLYQLPALLVDGVTLVISPLLALMRDQLNHLKNRFDIPAATINTDQLDEENFAAREAVLRGKIRILFIAPEQLEHIDRFQFLLNLPIKLLVVDEAHCISTWGHDFRPSYRHIIKLAKELTNKYSDIKLLALTATANDKTELDIKQQLRVDEKDIHVHRASMNRANIRLSLIRVSGTSEKLAVLTQLLHSLAGCGLIYCATRENTELVAEYLSSQGIVATAYHAGLDAQKKYAIQHAFIQDHYQVIAATNALGMGIDKSNLRFIIHFDFPGSITAYYQEIGRAGRDGLHSEGILLYDNTDSQIQQYFIDSAQPTLTDFQLVRNTLISSKLLLNLSSLKRLTGLHPTRLNVVLAELLEQEFIKKTSQRGSQIYELTSKKGAPNLLRYTTQLEVRSKELKSIQHYASQSRKCLMLVLRQALGDYDATACEQCSVCTTTPYTKTNTKDLQISINSWLERRTIPITLSKKIKNAASGMAVLDGKLRSPLFIHFMQQRMQTETIIANDLWLLIQDCFKDLLKHYRPGCIISLPSRTWGARTQFISRLASYLKIPALLDTLNWREIPLARQGELLNNDQRQHNVMNRMQAQIESPIPPGSILLVDDYVGGGATLNEAAKALRDLEIHNEIIPFTIAAVKWRLGKKGMI